MVAGHLHEKNGYYYIILNLTDSAGKRKPKWISTGLTIKGNKKRAEQMLMEERRKYANAKTGDDVLFADFMEQWLEIVKSTVSIPTYSSYVNAVKSIIAPYFRKKKILLRDLQAHDIQMFYSDLLSVKDIQQITGFSSSAIVRWISTGILKAFQPGKQYTVPKDFMLDFLISPYYRRIRRKTPLQKELMDTFERLWQEKGGE